MKTRLCVTTAVAICAQWISAATPADAAPLTGRRGVNLPWTVNATGVTADQIQFVHDEGSNLVRLPIYLDGSVPEFKLPADVRSAGHLEISSNSRAVSPAMASRRRL